MRFLVFGTVKVKKRKKFAKKKASICLGTSVVQWYRAILDMRLVASGPDAAIY